MHTLSDRTVLEAGTVSISDEWKTVPLNHSFSTTPVVIAQVQTVNEADAVVVHIRNVGRDQFEARLREQEAGGGIGPGREHAFEDVAYLAIEAGLGKTDGVRYRAGVTGSEVDEKWYELSFEEPFDSNPVLPVFLAHPNSENGPDTFNLRSRRLRHEGIQLRLEEDRSVDDETKHANERVGYFAVHPPGLIKLGGGGSFVITKIADFDTSIPEGEGLFTGLYDPVIEDSTVVFGGTGNELITNTSQETEKIQKGLYKWEDGVITKVANERDQVAPALTATIDQGSVYFGGVLHAPGEPSRSGLFVDDGNAINTLLLEGGVFEDFLWPSVDQGRVVAQVTGADDYRGLFLLEESRVRKIADTMDRGTFDFSWVSSPSIFVHGERFSVVFSGGEGRLDSSIYAYENGRLTREIDRFTSLPGSNRGFWGLGSAHMQDEDHLVFTGARDLYTSVENNLIPFGLFVKKLPGSPDPIGSLRDPFAAEAGTVFFSTYNGLYYYRSGVIIPVIQKGHELGGERTIDFTISPTGRAMGGDSLVFRLVSKGKDGPREGIYRALLSNSPFSEGSDLGLELD